MNVHGFTEKNKGVNFEEGLQALGVEFLYDAPATAILMEDGVATGVQCESGKDVINVNAKAVLVCTGGYLANEEKVAAEYGGCKVVNMGSLNNTGDGERIVLAAGGVATLHEKRYYAIFSENTVNAMKDSPYYQNIGAPAVWTSAATMFNAPLADFDANLASDQEEGWCFKASSIAELAEVTGLEALPETVTEYDSYVAAGADPDFLKDPAFLQLIIAAFSVRDSASHRCACPLSVGVRR